MQKLKKTGKKEINNTIFKMETLNGAKAKPKSKITKRKGIANYHDINKAKLVWNMAKETFD